MNCFHAGYLIKFAFCIIVESYSSLLGVVPCSARGTIFSFGEKNQSDRKLNRAHKASVPLFYIWPQLIRTDSNDRLVENFANIGIKNCEVAKWNISTFMLDNLTGKIA